MKKCAYVKLVVIIFEKLNARKAWKPVVGLGVQSKYLLLIMCNIVMVKRPYALEIRGKVSIATSEIK